MGIYTWKDFLYTETGSSFPSQTDNNAERPIMYFHHHEANMFDYKWHHPTTTKVDMVLDLAANLFVLLSDSSSEMCLAAFQAIWLSS